MSSKQNSGSSKKTSNDGSDGSNRFDYKKFNKEFDQMKNTNKQIFAREDEAKLAKLNADHTKKPSILSLSLFDLLVNLKDSWFDLTDDLLNKKFTMSVITKDNRLFYVGITLLFFAVVLYLYNSLVDDEPINTNIQEIHHIYHNVPPATTDVVKSIQ
jgi:hypothetical protein